MEESSVRHRGVEAIEICSGYITAMCWIQNIMLEMKESLVEDGIVEQRNIKDHEFERQRN